MKVRTTLIALALAFGAVAPVLANALCGPPPPPPPGCRSAHCVCDSGGQNCKWAFVCS